MNVPKRIHIIGSAGSGKTTLAQQLAKLHDLPVYELDWLGYDQLSSQRRPLDAKLQDVHEIAQQAHWITEGIFLMVDR